MGRKKSSDRLPDGLSRKADGRLRIKFSTTDPETGRRIYRVKTLQEGTSLSQAVTELEAMRRELERGSDPQTPTLGDYAEAWLERKSRSGKWSVSTSETYLYRLAHHVLPHIGHLRLDKIGRRDLLRWRTTLEGKPKSATTIKRIWSDGLQLLRDAFADFELPDPTHRLDGPAVRVKLKREQRTLSAVQLGQLVEALLDSPKPTSTWPVVALMVFTGCRRGEALALRWEDVDFGERIATIRRSVYHSKRSGWSEKPPKNGKPRIVGLPTKLVGLLADHRRAQLAAQHPGLRMGLVASPPGGGYCSYRSLRQALARSAKKAGIEQKVTCQVLRRSYNTLALQTMDRIMAQAIMGHADDAMSAQYLGLRPETIREAADKLWAD